MANQFFANTQKIVSAVYIPPNAQFVQRTVSFRFLHILRKWKITDPFVSSIHPYYLNTLFSIVHSWFEPIISSEIHRYLCLVWVLASTSPHKFSFPLLVHSGHSQPFGSTGDHSFKLVPDYDLNHLQRSNSSNTVNTFLASCSPVTIPEINGAKQLTLILGSPLFLKNFISLLIMESLQAHFFTRRMGLRKRRRHSGTVYTSVVPRRVYTVSKKIG